MRFLTPSRLVVCLAFAAIVSTISEFAAQQVDVSPDLNMLCTNDKKLKLKQSSQIKSLAQELRTNTDVLEKCPKNMVSALLNLDGLISLTEANVCSLESTNRIRNYICLMF
jgi:hypothetical protein